MSSIIGWCPHHPGKWHPRGNQEHQGENLSLDLGQGLPVKDERRNLLPVPSLGNRLREDPGLLEELAQEV